MLSNNPKSLRLSLIWRIIKWGRVRYEDRPLALVNNTNLDMRSLHTIRKPNSIIVLLLAQNIQTFVKKINEQSKCSTNNKFYIIQWGKFKNQINYVSVTSHSTNALFHHRLHSRTFPRLPFSCSVFISWIRRKHVTWRHWCMKLRHQEFANCIQPIRKGKIFWLNNRINYSFSISSS